MTSAGKGSGEALDAGTSIVEEPDKLAIVASIGDVTYTDKERYESDLQQLRDNVASAEAKLEWAEEYVKARQAALKDAEAELAAAEGN